MKECIISCDNCKTKITNDLYYTLIYSVDNSENHMCIDCSLKLHDTIKWLEKNGYKQKKIRDGWFKKNKRLEK